MFSALGLIFFSFKLFIIQFKVTLWQNQFECVCFGLTMRISREVKHCNYVHMLMVNSVIYIYVWKTILMQTTYWYWSTLQWNIFWNAHNFVRLLQWLLKFQYYSYGTNANNALKRHDYTLRLGIIYTLRILPRVINLYNLHLLIQQDKIATYIIKTKCGLHCTLYFELFLHIYYMMLWNSSILLFHYIY